MPKEQDPYITDGEPEEAEQNQDAGRKAPPPLPEAEADPRQTPMPERGDPV